MKRMIKNISVLGLAMAFAVTGLSNSVAYAASYPDVELSGAESETTNEVDTSVYKSSVDATFSITADMLGGDLVVEIPDAIDLVSYKANKDTADTLFAGVPIGAIKPSGNDDFYAVADVGVSGNLIPSKKLCISLTREMNGNRYGVWFNHESAVDSAKVFSFIDLMDTVSDDTSNGLELSFKLDAEEVYNCSHADTVAGTFSFVVTNDVYVGDYSTTLNFNISTEDI